VSQMIEPFLNQAAATALRAQPVEFEEPQHRAPEGPALCTDVHPLHALRVRLQVSVGAADMSVGELLAARENEVLVLDRAVQDPVDLTLEGKVVARGQLVVVAEGLFAVRITELPLPLKL
jgi:flagellar motor switch protein FliN/FliY